MARIITESLGYGKVQTENYLFTHQPGRSSVDDNKTRIDGGIGDKHADTGAFLVF